MPDIMMRLGREMLVIDGAMGTMLQRAGYGAGTCNELLNLVEPDAITQIHTNYVLAGADCVTTNTFGASRTKLAEYHLDDQVADINRAGVRLARASGAQHVLADIGPTGLLLRPLGETTFDELYEVFAEQAAALGKGLGGPDAFILETFTDIAELRIAVLACKETVPELPVFASITCSEAGRTDLSGTDPETAAIIVEAAGADAVGLNCGLGPAQMESLVTEMIAATTLPVFVRPNAGLPELTASGDTRYPGTADEMAAFARVASEAGVAAVGSCCGSTPSFTGAIADEIAGAPCVHVADRGFDRPVVASPREYHVIGGGNRRRADVPDDERRLTRIGERINPTGKPELRASLEAGSTELAVTYALEQEAAGADMLDINVGGAGVDEVTMLPLVVEAVGAAVDVPLSIDTMDAEALERALCVYPGRALVNSVSGEVASRKAILPLVKRYGACAIALALDERGIPVTAPERVEVIETIRRDAQEYGIASSRLVADTLVLTMAADPTAPRTTLEALRLVGEAGMATVLGISNVSHGMEDRATVNAKFLADAVAAGLDAAIINVNESPSARITASLTDDEVAQMNMTTLAEKFKTGEIFLPQLMRALELMRTSADADAIDTASSKGTIVFATVHGDIHSIGKEICAALLTSQGYRVVDLGVDVPAATVVKAARTENPCAVCLSALMTTTLPAMRETIEALHDALPDMPVCVGGAVVTKEWAHRAHAHYSTDAPSCVLLVDEVGSKARADGT